MSLLFTPVTIRGIEFRNRLWVSPMGMFNAPEGVPAAWHRTHLAQFAAGGAGLVMAEATAVSHEGRYSPVDTGIWNDEQRDAWAPIVADIHQRGAKAGIQIAHAGRKAPHWWPASGREGAIAPEDGGWTPVAPTAIAYPGLPEPTALDEAGIRKVVDDHVSAARRAVEAGFDVIEIHAAHGYLLHQFLSPLTNHRDDAWGGSLEHRERLVVDVVRAVRAEIGDETAVFVRFSGTDAAPGGLTPEVVGRVARHALDAGADLNDVSSAGLVAEQHIDVFPGYQVPLAAEVRLVSGGLTGAVGLISTPQQAEDILRAGDADVVFAGRAWLKNPHFGLHAADELLGTHGHWPIQYVRASRARMEHAS